MKTVDKKTTSCVIVIQSETIALFTNVIMRSLPDFVLSRLYFSKKFWSIFCHFTVSNIEPQSKIIVLPLVTLLILYMYSCSRGKLSNSVEKYSKNFFFQGRPFLLFFRLHCETFIRCNLNYKWQQFRKSIQNSILTKFNE